LTWEGKKKTKGKRDDHSRGDIMFRQRGRLFGKPISSITGARRDPFQEKRGNFSKRKAKGA